MALFKKNKESDSSAVKQVKTKQIRISAKQKNMLTVGVIVAIAIGQVAYLLTVRQSTINKVAELTDIKFEMATVLKGQEGRLRNIEQLRYELEMTKSQTESLINIIPTATSTIEEFIDLTNFMTLYDFKNVTVEQVETQSYTTALTEVIEKKYNISYVAPYSDSQKFIAQLNNSPQLVAIKGCTIDTTPQADVGLSESLHDFDDKMKEVVLTNLTISLYMVAGDTEIEEPYSHSFAGINTPDDVFFDTTGVNAPLILEKEQEGHTPSTGTGDGSTEEVVDDTHDTYFELELWDVLASGDNYSFSSPGNVDSLYTGMKTSKDMTINLDITDTGYTVAMKDADGLVKSNTTTYAVNKPMLSIMSNMVQVQETMPKIKIQINNKSSDTLKIDLKGSLLNTITILNEQGTPITETSTGDIRLIN